MDPIVENMIRLHREVEEAAKSGSVVEGWRPLRIDSKGWVIAGKNLDGEYKFEQFYPIGKWKNAHDYLELQAKLRALLFSDLSPEQINSYRAATGLSPVDGN